MRPKNLTGISIWLATLNCFQFVFWINAPPEYQMPIWVFFGVVIIAFAIIFAFSKGQNWARILIIISSVLAIPAVFMSTDYGTSGVIIAIIEAITGLYLLYWLNTASVKGYFGKIKIKVFFFPKLSNESNSIKLINLCAFYFFTIATLYLVFALTNFGTWNLKSIVIYENILLGLIIVKRWKTVVLIFVFVQILLLTYIFIGNHGLKIINFMSLIVLIYANFAIAKHNELKAHNP